MYVYLTPQNVIWSSGEGKLRLLKACLSSAGTQVSSPCLTLTHLASASPHFHLFALFALLCFVWMEPCAFGPEPHSQPLSSHFEIALLGSSCFLHVLPGVVSESDCTWDKCSSNIVDGLFDPGYKLDSSSLLWVFRSLALKHFWWEVWWIPLWMAYYFFFLEAWKTFYLFGGCLKLLVQGLLS